MGTESTKPGIALGGEVLKGVYLGDEMIAGVGQSSIEISNTSAYRVGGNAGFLNFSKFDLGSYDGSKGGQIKYQFAHTVGNNYCIGGLGSYTCGKDCSYYSNGWYIGIIALNKETGANTAYLRIITRDRKSGRPTVELPVAPRYWISPSNPGILYVSQYWKTFTNTNGDAYYNMTAVVNLNTFAAPSTIGSGYAKFANRDEYNAGKFEDTPAYTGMPADRVEIVPADELNGHRYQLQVFKYGDPGSSTTYGSLYYQIAS